MAEYPVLPIFTDALLGDTQHLTQAEFGAYMLMLIVAWRSPDCSLHNDPKYLARITRSVRNWRDIGAAVLPFWTLGEDNQLRQKRLSQTRLRARTQVEQQRQAGRASALKRQHLQPTGVASPLQRSVNGNPTNLNHIQDLEDASASSSPPAPREKDASNGRGTRIDPDWQPSPEDHSFATALGLDASGTAAGFRDYWIAKAGPNGVKRSWPATWRNWCRREAEQGRGNGTGQKQSGGDGRRDYGIVEAASRVIARRQGRTDL